MIALFRFVELQLDLLVGNMVITRASDTATTKTNSFTYHVREVKTDTHTLRNTKLCHDLVRQHPCFITKSYDPHLHINSLARLDACQ